MAASRQRGSGSRLRHLGGLRLRHKLSASLVVAALLPVLVASWVAISVVLRSLERGLRAETDRQLKVGLNLVLRNVQRLGHEAARLGNSSDLLAATRAGPGAIDDALARESPHLPSALIQVTDADGVIQARRVIGGVVSRFDGLDVDRSAAAVEAARRLERKVTVVSVGSRLVVRASAPIVDGSFKLSGVVVISLPLDGDFAQSIKSALDSHVLIFSGVTQGSRAGSTFLDPIGGHVVGVALDPGAARAVARGRQLIENARIAERDYSLGYAPLLDIDGTIVGVLAVAVDRGPLLSAQTTAKRSLALGAAGALVFALGLAGLLSRRMTRPLQKLHEGAIAIARGDLEQEIDVTPGDEIGDLATAFAHMTTALKENQRRLAARMREIVALHDAGRAVSSVIELDQVLKKIVDSVARVLHVRVCALWLVKNPDAPIDRTRAGNLELGAARAKREDMRMIIRGDEVAAKVEPLGVIALDVAAARQTLRIDCVADDAEHAECAMAAGVTGSMVATPLERKGKVLGVIVIGRSDAARAFSEADANLLATFADQAATTVENAQLYAEVRASSEELEAKVRLRTHELMAINSQLATAITELRDTQAQLVLSERMAVLGQLVAGVAHEINSPSAAIRGTIDVLGDNVTRLTRLANQVSEDVPADERETLTELCNEWGPRLAQQRIPSPAVVRRLARTLRESLIEEHVDRDEATRLARSLSKLGPPHELVEQLMPMMSRGPTATAEAVIGFLTEVVYLQRSTRTIDHAIGRIQRIVGGLKTYTHLDQEGHRIEADVHEGIENTLVLFEHLLSHGIRVTRDYGVVAPIPVFVDELNQVWTNLVHNALQAVAGEGEIGVSTMARDGGVVVRVVNDGPGIPQDVLPRIFEPFFTTKKKGEGTGLGLGIVRQIVDKHQGRVFAESKPGRTCFEVWLPGAEGATKSQEDAGVGGVPTDSG